MIFYIFIASALIILGCNCDIISVNNTNDLLNISNRVNNGDSFEGTTVVLTSDITFTTVFSPIGRTSYRYFNGTFDGQGYIISSFTSYPSSQYTGLFGFSKGATFRNVVFDQASLFKGDYSPYCYSSGGCYYPYVGSIIGYCSAEHGPCIIENVINIGNTSLKDITYSNYIYTRYLGGIIGVIESKAEHEVVIKNCANYGNVIILGEVYNSFIGGIVGYSSGKLDSEVKIQNCFNLNEIYNNGIKTSKIGGIVGNAYYSIIDNCVNYGYIYSYYNNLDGNIVGYMSYSLLNRCFWRNNWNYGNINSGSYVLVEKSSLLEDFDTISDDISIGSYTGNSLLAVLNSASDYYNTRGYSRWIYNVKNKNISFKVDDRINRIVLNSKLIILPNFANGTFVFNGWYTDEGCNVKLTKNIIEEESVFYGMLGEKTGNCTISFDTHGGSSIDPIMARPGTIVNLPIDKSPRKKCVFKYWVNEYGDKISWKFVVPTHNVTLCAMLLNTSITTVEDFVEFSNNIQYGSTYLGLTMFLEADIDFTDKLSHVPDPIGSNEKDYFCGTFDGQGHVISGLFVNSSSRYVGFFGRSSEMTIKNVVIDDSCSIISSYNGTYGYTGGIIGYCESCIVENNVNMANVNFAMNQSCYIGGIAGYLYFKNDHTCIKNCVNYGSVTKTFYVYSGFSYAGGIVGNCGGSLLSKKYIMNCLNYGYVSSNVYIYTSSGAVYIGGIVGYSSCMYINNCVSAGRIYSYSNKYIGGIAGGIYDMDKDTISNCYWKSEFGFGYYNAYGGEFSFLTNSSSSFNSTLELNETVYVGQYEGNSLIEALDAAVVYYKDREYSNWIINNKTVSFKINNRERPIKMNSTIILLPSLASERKVLFDGWYTNIGCTERFVENTNVDHTVFYGKWEENNDVCTITFDPRGGYPIEPMKVRFGSVVMLPNISKRSHHILWWENDYGDIVLWNFTVHVRNITLHARWLCTHITTADEFAALFGLASYGFDYSGLTILIGSDINMEGKSLTGIGTFCGEFDGQGYIIDGFRIRSGIIEYLKGTFRNVIIGGSSSIYGDFHVGIISHTSKVLENIVSMAVVYGSSYYTEIGGIVGTLSSDGIVKNCLNYGTVSYSGSDDSSCVGGIVGRAYKFSTVANCLFYGTIKSGYSSKCYVGGILGYAHRSSVFNCVSAGTMSTTDIKTINKGGIIGCGDTYSIDTCFWIQYLNISGYCDNNGYYSSGSSKSVDSTTFEKLNDYATKYNYNEWFYVQPTYYVNGEKKFSTWRYCNVLFTLSSGGGRAFSGWFTDSSYTKRFNSSEYSYYTASLYGLWNYTVEFLEYGTIPACSKVVTYSKPYGTLPVPSERIGYSFSGWYDKEIDGNLVTSETNVNISCNHILTAYWHINNYILSFDYRNGTTINKTLKYRDEIKYPDYEERIGYETYGWSYTENTMPAYNLTIALILIPKNYTVRLNENYGDGTISPETTMNVTYDKPYGTLSVPSERIGYTFVGWYDKEVDGNLVTSETNVNISCNHILTAYWHINNYILSFDYRNGTTINKTLKYRDEIKYLDYEERIGYETGGWNYTENTMPAYNLTIALILIPKNYTVGLNENYMNGTVSPETTINVTYDKPYGTLPVPSKRIGYIFVGWYDNEDDGNIITNETLFKEADNITLYAHWKENTMNQVDDTSKEKDASLRIEFTFDTKELNEEVIRSIIQKYADDNFSIVKIESTPDETIVTVKFTSVEKAEEFIENFRSSSNSMKSHIKDVKFVFSDTRSNSFLPCPILSFITMIS